MTAANETLILGAGRSGIALARLLRARGGVPVLADEKLGPEVLPADLAELRFLGGAPERSWLDGMGTLALSPGVPQDGLLPTWAAAAGIKVTGEIELAASHTEIPALAITGTNGKSTTTTLASLMLEAQGMTAPAGGNLGRPYSALVLEEEEADLHVLEISSFQSETCERFSPVCAALLNLKPDHLDRYSCEEEYYAAKLNLFAGLGPEQHLVLPWGDTDIAERLVNSTARRIHFGLGGPVSSGCYLEDGILRMCWGGEVSDIIPASDLRLVGLHNVANALAAASCVLPFGADARAIAEVLRSFAGLPHRMEEVGSLAGMRCFNDSKATNVDATLASLGGLSASVILIAGGRDKGGDFAALADKLSGVRLVLGIGESGAAIAEAFGDRGKDCGDLEQALVAARAAGRDGEWCVLSPACSSYDQYSNFEERGDHLRQLIEEENRCGD